MTAFERYGVKKAKKPVCGLLFPRTTNLIVLNGGMYSRGAESSVLLWRCKPSLWCLVVAWGGVGITIIYKLIIVKLDQKSLAKDDKERPTQTSLFIIII